jgi:hypothetical protein
VSVPDFVAFIEASACGLVERVPDDIHGTRSPSVDHPESCYDCVVGCRKQSRMTRLCPSCSSYWCESSNAAASFDAINFYGWFCAFGSVIYVFLWPLCSDVIFPRDSSHSQTTHRPTSGGACSPHRTNALDELSGDQRNNGSVITNDFSLDFTFLIGSVASVCWNPCAASQLFKRKICWITNATLQSLATHCVEVSSCIKLSNFEILFSYVDVLKCSSYQWNL